jgi:hypothetical protein
MTTRTAMAAGVGAIVLAVGGFTAADQLGVTPLSATETTTVAAGAMGCNDWPGAYTQRECFAAGTLLTSLQNLQPAVQFCKWRDANPGEWTRIQGYASTATLPTQIVTWMGAHIRDDVMAYLAAGGPTFTLALATPPPNACTGKLVKPPAIVGVTPGQTDATVTVTTTP